MINMLERSVFLPQLVRRRPVIGQDCTTSLAFLQVRGWGLPSNVLGHRLRVAQPQSCRRSVVSCDARQPQKSGSEVSKPLSVLELLPHSFWAISLVPSRFLHSIMDAGFKEKCIGSARLQWRLSIVGVNYIGLSDFGNRTCNQKNVALRFEIVALGFNIYMPFCNRVQGQNSFDTVS